MRNKRLAILSGLAMLASILTLTPEPAGARGGFGGGGFHGGGFGGGFHGGGFGGGGFAGRGFAAGGFRGAGFAGSRAMALGGPGFRSVGVVGRPGWGGAAWRGAAWRGGWAGAGWRRGWGWGWPVAAGLAAGAIAASTWDYPYADDGCVFWNGFTWVNGCYQSYGWW